MNNDLKEFANILFAPSERDEYKRRIDKAIEYIDYWKTTNYIHTMNFEDDQIKPFDLGKLRNILKGKNNND